MSAKRITDDNQHLLRYDQLIAVPNNPYSTARRSGYVKRTEKELAVLERWFPKESIDEIEKAEYLDIILYSREQIELESKAMNDEFPFSAEDQKEVEWGIVAIKAQNEDFELPMNPITILRNALGVEHGGSGVALDPAKYNHSVAYWSKFAAIK